MYHSLSNVQRFDGKLNQHIMHLKHNIIEIKAQEEEPKTHHRLWAPNVLQCYNHTHRTKNHISHRGPETKWTPFSKRHFEMDFLESKFMTIRLKFHWSLFLRD